MAAKEKARGLKYYFGALFASIGGGIGLIFGAALGLGVGGAAGLAAGHALGKKLETLAKKKFGRIQFEAGQAAD